MKKYLIPFLFLVLFSYAHSAKADTYFSQPNSNGNILFEYTPFVHVGHTFVGDDASRQNLGPYDPAFIADFAWGSTYPIATTSATSYVTDITLQVWDSNTTENANYQVQFICLGSDGTYHGSYISSPVNSSTFSSGFTNVDFKFSTPNCDLSKYQVHQLIWYQPASGGPTGQTPIQFRALNNNSFSNFGIASEGGAYYDDYEPQIIINSGTGQVAKTPILIIPGVLGTDIFKGTDLLWANPKMARSFDGFMDPLAFNSDLTPLDTSLIKGGVIREKSVLIFHSDYINGLINQLTSPDIGYTEGKDLFTFPYDWRFGVSEDNVNQLKGEIAYIASTTGSSTVNIVAHSTGGLLVKKYVMENPTNHHIGKAVFVGVPNLGAPKAFKTLINGDNFDVIGLDPVEMMKIGQNMPVVYDLAPSPQYEKQVGAFFHFSDQTSNPKVDKDLNYSSTISFLENQNLLNTQAVLNSQKLHSIDFDNYDLRNVGVDLYSIVGCKTGTFGKFSEFKNLPQLGYIFDYPKNTTGDGTVPFGSADSLPVDATKTFFAPQIKHGDLLSANGARQQIVNLLTGSNLSTNGKILTHYAVQNNPNLCQIKGESIKIKSPVSIGVTDQDGNFSGLASDGSIQNDIPGADYEIWGEHKYVFLPTDSGQTYNIHLAGTGAGTFTLDDESINGDASTQTQVFSNLPVTTSLSGQVNLGTTDTLSLDTNGDGAVDQTVQPSSVINGAQSQDLTPPISTTSIAGIMGQPSYYRSNATITITATDPIVNNDPTQTSGVLKTQYELDGAGYQACPPSPQPSPIGGGSSCSVAVTAEGAHILKFFSTDNAGNNEQPQTINFIIDKTAPEISMQFNPTTKDLAFTGTDNISTSTGITLTDNGGAVTATDQAGNTTQLNFVQKNRKTLLKADIASLLYNNVVQDISKTKLSFFWLYDKNNNLAALSQAVQSKKNFTILSVYGLGKTIILGKDQTGNVSKTLNGLNLLKVATNKGDFSWAY